MFLGSTEQLQNFHFLNTPFRWIFGKNFLRAGPFCPKGAEAGSAGLFSAFFIEGFLEKHVDIEGVLGEKFQDL